MHPSTTSCSAETAAWCRQLLDSVSTTLPGVRPDHLDHLRRQVARLTTVPTTTTPTPTDAAAPVTIRTSHALLAAVEVLQAEPLIALDLETSSLVPDQGEIVGIGLAAGRRSFYIPVAHRHEAGRRLLTDQLSVAAVARAVNFREWPLVAHNALFEFHWVRHHFGVAPHFHWDTYLGARLLRSDLPGDLEKLAIRELDVLPWALTTVELKRIQFLSVDTVAAYCCKDALYTWRIATKQKGHIQ